MDVRSVNRRTFLELLSLGVAGLAASCRMTPRLDGGPPAERPHILVCMADDWSRPHAGAYGDPAVRTPTFDRIAREGVLFENAFVSSPSCTPSRSAVLTGQYHWRLGEAANLWSTLNVSYPVYPLLLQAAGYHVGFEGKCWGPGDLKAGGYVYTNPGGRRFPKGFRAFLEARPEEKPFCFWLGSHDPHRPYEAGSGRAAGIDLSRIRVPGFLPDVPEVRSDLADYLFEVQRFDTSCGAAMRLLEERGMLEKTLVVVTGDNGMPFPRCKSNLYDYGVRVPMAVRWGARVPPRRTVNDFVSFTDLAPTFLEAAGVPVPEVMTGRSLLAILESSRSGRVDPARDHAIFGKERHVPAQKAPDMSGYPCRGIRTDRFLYIRNFAPERWPAGVPEGATHPMGRFADCDNGPTKAFLMEHREDPAFRPYFDLAFAKRPAEELYDVEEDPDQKVNRAGEAAYETARSELAARLDAALRDTGDPRVLGEPVLFDTYPYRSRYRLNTSPSRRR